MYAKIENMFSVFLSSYRNTYESFVRTQSKKPWKHSPVGSCSHCIFQAPNFSPRLFILTRQSIPWFTVSVFQRYALQCNSLRNHWFCFFFLRQTELNFLLSVYFFGAVTIFYYSFLESLFYRCYGNHGVTCTSR